MSSVVCRGQYDSRVSYKKFKYKWAIESFSSWMTEAGTVRQSSPFPADGAAEDHSPYQWCLQFYPKGLANESYCSLCVSLLTGPEPIDAEIELCLINSANKIIIKHVDEQRFQPGVDVWGWENLVKTDYLLRQTRRGDQLTIACTVRSSVGIADHASVGSSTQVESAEEELTSMQALLNEQKYGNIVVLVKDKPFLACKELLAAKSSVLSELLRDQLTSEGAGTPYVTINSIEPAVFNEMLRYMYTGSVQNLGCRMVYDLVAAADRFKIVALKEMCQQSIWFKYRG